MSSPERFMATALKYGWMTPLGGMSKAASVKENADVLVVSTPARPERYTLTPRVTVRVEPFGARVGGHSVSPGV